MSATTASITDTASAFFELCETGKGWEACSSYCTPNATFQAQSEPLSEITTLKDYVDWMQGMSTVLPDAGYEIRSFATDHDRQNVCAYAVFSGTHTGEGGPMPPTGKHANTDYVYVMQFQDGKISHMTKIWNSTWAMRQLGWLP